jgi:hypothetical protein
MAQGRCPRTSSDGNRIGGENESILLLFESGVHPAATDKVPVAAQSGDGPIAGFCRGVYAVANRSSFPTREAEIADEGER